MPKRTPTIKELSFPGDDRIWQIDWLGSIDRIDPEARIKVHLSLKGQSSHSITARKEVQIGIGLLPFLTIGSLWQHGRRLQENLGEQLNLPAICIPPKPTESWARKRLPDFKNGRRWLIPNFAHPVQESYSESPCLSIEYEGDPHGIVIPAIEVIRFYYAVSSDLTHIAFNGDLQLQKDQVLNPHGKIKNGLQDDGSMVLNLRKHLEDDDAWILGRILASQHNQSAFNWIYNSLVYNRRNDRSLYAKAGLPFIGHTSWQARGQWLPSDLPGKRRYLIYELQSCSASFPFENLIVFRDNDNRQGNQESDEYEHAWANRPASIRSDKDAEIQSQHAPHSELTAVDIPNVGERFTALLGKKVIKHDKEKNTHQGHARTHDEPITALGTGTTSSSQDAKGIAPARLSWEREGEIQKRPALTASFDNLMLVIGALQRIPGVMADKRSPSTLIAHIPLTKRPGLRQWSYLESSTLTLRQVIVVDVQAQDKHGCLVEFECRPYEHVMAALLISATGSPITNEVIHAQLTRLAAAQGVWSAITTWPENVHCHLFKHSRPTPDEFAQAIHHALVGELPKEHYG